MAISDIAHGQCGLEDPSAVDRQHKELVSLQLEADVLQEQMECLKQQIKTAERDSSISRSSLGHLSRVSTASGSGGFSASSPSLDEDLTIEEQCRYRLQIADLEEQHCQLLAEREARIRRERDALLAQHLHLEDADAHAADVEEQLSIAAGELRNLSGNGHALQHDRLSSVGACSASDVQRSTSHEFATCCRGLAHTRVIIGDASAELAKATEDFDEVHSARELLLLEHWELAESLQQAREARSGVHSRLARARRQCAEAPQRLADERDEIQAQLRSAALETQHLQVRCSQACSSTADAARSTAAISQRVMELRACNQELVWSRAEAASASADDINVRALKVEWRNAEAAATEFRTMLRAASVQYSRLQAASAQRIRQLQLSAEAHACERRCFSMAAARMHALAVEVRPHVEMLERLVQDERAQGEALQHTILAGVSCPVADAVEMCSVGDSVPRRGSAGSAKWEFATL